jgi:hypothetical protein
LKQQQVQQQKAQPQQQAKAAAPIAPSKQQTQSHQPKQAASPIKPAAVSRGNYEDNFISGWFELPQAWIAASKAVGPPFRAAKSQIQAGKTNQGNTTNQNGKNNNNNAQAAKTNNAGPTISQANVTQVSVKPQQAQQQAAAPKQQQQGGKQKGGNGNIKGKSQPTSAASYATSGKNKAAVKDYSNWQLVLRPKQTVVLYRPLWKQIAAWQFAQRGRTAQKKGSKQVSIPFIK